MKPILCLVGAMAGALSLQAQPVIGAIVNSASYQGTLAPGSWATLFGTGLASTEATASSVPLPRSLAGISVFVNGIAAPLRYVSARQINFVVPFEIAVSGSTVVPVKVVSQTESASYNLRLVTRAPAVFTQDGTPSGPAHVFDGSFRPLQTVDSGAAIILYAAGLGPTSPPVPSESGGAATEPLNRVSDPVEVYVGDAPATVSFAGMAPGFPGVYQLNVATPPLLTGRVYVRSGAWQSNVADIAIPAGANVANVSGTIDGLYPLTALNQPPVFMPAPWKVSTSFSAMPMAGIFSVAFDIRAGAKPFSVVATSEAAHAVITFDPAAGTYSAVITVPDDRARNGDFALSEFQPLLDFMSCKNGVCQPFPGYKIPGNRIDPVWGKVLQFLPRVNVAPSSPSSMGVFQAQGEAPAGSRFVIDWNHHPELCMFGGFLQISPGLPVTRSTTFRLYVDGKLIESKDGTYDVIQEQ